MKRVLVVDDGSMVCMAIEISLERYGFESIRIFHERAPTIPLIAMSGYAFANHVSLAAAHGARTRRCLCKPFTPGALLANDHDSTRLKDALARRRCARWRDASIAARHLGFVYHKPDCLILFCSRYLYGAFR
jgi:DNA-binding NtrC family response regulator